MIRLAKTLALASTLLASVTGAALAHPHIFVDARATITFNAEGDLVGIRHAWTFDEPFSVWQVQGLDTNGDGVTSSEEMQELADENLKGLAEYGFYTSVGMGAQTLHFVPDGPARFDYENSRSTLSFAMAPDHPVRLGERLEIAIADPEYYVAITLRGMEDVTVEGLPDGCIAHYEPPREVSPDLQGRLFDLGPEVTQLPPDLEQALRGTQGAIVVDCTPGAVAPAPETALEAVNQVAQARPVPFGGPPPEPGFVLPRTGVLGWVARVQEDFYRGLNSALTELKTDWNAFWVLGTLSFLYGVFHAAGPGHGKVVIGSYMLANERQLKRGISLSFAAALMQSVVAVAFVMIAAGILGLSSIAMADAVGWIEKGSYALVALLGLWLIIRTVFGLGHSHHHEPAPDLANKAHAHLHADETRDAHGRLPGDPHYGHDHGHDHHPHGHDHHDHDHGHEHAHVHAVTPDNTGGDWREQLGVVLGVGLRPCSGALVVLAFALSQGILPAGIVAVFLMGLGTGITVAVLASIAVGAKGLATRYLGRDGKVAGRIVWAAELIGAIVVFLFGVTLLLASLGWT